MRRLSGSGSGFGSNSGSFFKRFSISGSRKGSFTQDIAQSVDPEPVPLEGSEQGVNDSTASYDAQAMLNNMILSTQSDRDDQSEASSASAMKGGGRSLKSVFKRTPKKTKITTTLSIIEEFSRIKNDWMHNSTQAGVPLSNSILTEFAKRTTAALTSDRKSKLNFSRCELNDIQLKLLVQELAQKPVLSKLDISHNSISSTGVEYIKHLLISQLELSAFMDPTVRENAVFMSEVIVSKSKLAITTELLDEIESLTAALAHHNAKNSIYSAYSSISCPERVEQTGLVSMWTHVFDRPPDSKTLKAMLKESSSSSGVTRKDLAYAEIEAFMMTNFVKQGILQKITAKQDSIIAKLIAKLPVRRLTLPPSGGSAAGSARDSEAFGDFGHGGSVAESARDGEVLGDFGHYPEEDNLSCASRDSSVHVCGEAEVSSEGLPSPPKLNVKSGALSEASVDKLRASDRQRVGASAELIEASVPSQIAVKSSPPPPGGKRAQQHVRAREVENITTPPLSPVRENRSVQRDMVDIAIVGEKGLNPALSSPIEKSSPDTASEKQSLSPVSPTATSQPGLAAVPQSGSPFAERAARSPINTSAAAAPLAPSNMSDRVKSEYSPSSQRLESLSSLSTPASRLSYSPTSTIASSPRSALVGEVRTPNSLITQLSSVESRPSAPVAAKNSTAAAAQNPTTAALKNPTATAKNPIAAHVVAKNLTAATAAVKNAIAAPVATSSPSLSRSPTAASSGPTAVTAISLSQPQSQTVSAASVGSYPRHADSPPDPARSKPMMKLVDEVPPAELHQTSAVNKTTALPVAATAPLSTSPKSVLLQSKKVEANEKMNINKISTAKPLHTQQPQTVSCAKMKDDSLNKTPSEQRSATLTSLSTEPTLSEDSIAEASWEDVQDSAFAIDLSDHELDSSDYKSLPHIPAATQYHLPVDECKANTGTYTPDFAQVLVDRQEKAITQDAQRTLTESLEYPTQSTYHPNTLAATAPTFVIHGIPRKKFSLVELDKLASLPRILLATDLTDGTQFTIGCYPSSPSKRHSHSTVVNQSSYVRNLDGSQSRAVLVLSNLDLDYTQLTAELQHKDSQLIETAIMQSCKINSLPPLQLNERLSRLIELDLRHCSLAGRLPANALPRGLLRLDLSHNLLTEFSGAATCTSLQELNLSNNLIETVHVVPRTLVRLDLENNLIWNKLCLRIIALSAKLQSVCLEGNPVTVLVPGWAAQLRSMGSRLHYMDGRAVPLGANGQPVQSRTLSPTAKYMHLHHTSATGSNARKVQLTSYEQQQHDEERAKTFQNRHIENEWKREMYLETLLDTAAKVAKPEQKLIETANRLSEPKFTSPKQLPARKKSSIDAMQKSTFGIGRVDFDRHLGLNVDAVKHGPSYLTPTPPAPPFKPKISSVKWNKNTALDTLNKWISQAGEGLDCAAKLINRVDHTIAQINRPVTMEDMQEFQRELVDVKLDSCDPLTFAVKLALDTMRMEVSLVRTITQLHEKVIGYNAVLHQLESALILCAGANKTFATSFHIIMHSEIGMALSEVPREEILPAQEGVQRAQEKLHCTAEPDNSNVNSNSDQQQQLTKGSNNNNSSSRSPPTKQQLRVTTGTDRKSRSPSGGSPRSPDNKEVAAAAHAWRVQAEHDHQCCAVILHSLTANITSTAPDSTDSTTERKLTQCFEQFQKEIKQINVSQYNFMTPTLAKQAERDSRIMELLKELRSFHSLFTQVENMLLLCMKGGISFLPAFEVLMNSAAGRAVKKALRGANHVSILAPCSSMRCQSVDDSLGTVSSASSPGGGRPVDALTTAAPGAASAITETAQAEVAAFVPFSELALETADDLAGLALVSTLPSTGSDTVAAAAGVSTAAQSDSSLQVGQDSTATVPTISTNTAVEGESNLNESMDQLEFAVIDPNTATVEAWMQRCECILGRAAVTLNSIIQHAHTGLPISTEDLQSFHQDRLSIDIISCEPPSKEVSAALHTLKTENNQVLLQKSALLRHKLDAYDDFFLQIENAMELCLEDRYDFQYAFDLLMRTELGKCINDNMHSIYDYSTMYDE